MLIITPLHVVCVRHQQFIEIDLVYQVQFNVGTFWEPTVRLMFELIFQLLQIQNISTNHYPVILYKIIFIPKRINLFEYSNQRK